VKKAVKKAVKKKVAAKKPKKTAAKKKKTLTPEQKENAEIRKLKQMALLKGPTFLPETAWSVYLSDNMRGSEGKLTDRVKAIATSFKTLPESEKERLTSIGNSNKIANQETKKKWIESFPPEAIHTANLARRRLARLTDKSKIFLIHDDRLPQRAGSSFTVFIQEQFSQSGSESPKEAMRSLGERWRSLSPEEKAPYQRKAAERSKASGGQLKELREKGAKYWKEKLASASASN
ncbi:hmg box, partial [Trichoderma arundinaceum]